MIMVKVKVMVMVNEMSPLMFLPYHTTPQFLIKFLTTARKIE